MPLTAASWIADQIDADACEEVRTGCNDLLGHRCPDPVFQLGIKAGPSHHGGRKTSAVSGNRTFRAGGADTFLDEIMQLVAAVDDTLLD